MQNNNNNQQFSIGATPQIMQPLGSQQLNPVGNQQFVPRTNLPYNPNPQLQPQQLQPQMNQPFVPSANLPYNPNPQMNQPFVPPSNQPFVPAPNQPFIPASNQPFIPSTNQPFVPPSNQPFIPAPNQPFVPPSNQPFIPSTPIASFPPTTNQTSASIAHLPPALRAKYASQATNLNPQQEQGPETIQQQPQQQQIPLQQQQQQQQQQIPPLQQQSFGQNQPPLQQQIPQPLQQPQQRYPQNQPYQQQQQNFTGPQSISPTSQNVSSNFGGVGGAAAGAAAASFVTHYEEVPVARNTDFLSYLAQVSSHDSVLSDTVFPEEEVDSTLKQGPAYERLKSLKHLQPPAWMCKATMWCIPNASATRTKMHLPIGIIIRPLAQPPHGSKQIPVVNFGSAGVIRCVRCRNYINPFVTFVDDGRRWRCNLCSQLSEVPTPYYCALDPTTGKRLDHDNRPELSSPVIEIVATEEYTVRTPQSPAYVFVIDVSYQAVQSGMVASVCATILENIDSFPGSDRAFVSVLAFDSALHFFSLDPALSQPQCYVVTDITDIFLPVPSNLFVRLSECRSILKILLEQLPAMFANTREQATCVGSAMKAAQQLQSHVGGKMYTFIASLPSIGLGPLRNREDPRSVRPGPAQSGDQAKPQTLFSAESKWYEEFATMCSSNQVSVDTFFFPANSEYLDVTTIGHVSRLTCGQTYYFPQFNARLDGKRLNKTLTRVLTRPMGFEAVIRVRSANQINVQMYFGHFFNRTADLIGLSNIDADKTFGVKLAYKDSVITAKEIYIQSALLYTTASSERRVRVMNMCLPVVDNVDDVYNHMDVSTTINMFAKSIVPEIYKNFSVVTIRETLMQQIVDILHQYRMHCPQKSKQPNYLLLPKQLRLFPLYILGLFNNIALRPSSTEPGSDLKSGLMDLMATCQDHEVLRLLVPRLYPVHLLDPQLGQMRPKDILNSLPTPLQASQRSLNADGVYLLDSFFTHSFWIGRTASPVIVEALTGQQSVSGDLVYNPSQTSIGLAIEAVRDALTHNTWFSPQVCVYAQDSAAAQHFHRLLIQDPSSGFPNYADFIARIHDQVLLSKSI